MGHFEGREALHQTYVDVSTDTSTDNGTDVSADFSAEYCDDICADISGDNCADISADICAENCADICADISADVSADNHVLTLMCWNEHSIVTTRDDMFDGAVEPQASRERMTMIMLQTSEVTATNVSVQAELSLYASW